MSFLKRYSGYILTAAVSFILGLFFAGVLVGYSFTGYILFLVGFAALFFMVLKIMSRRYPGPCRFILRFFVIMICVGVVFTAGTAIYLVASGSNSNNENADYAIVFGAGVNGRTPSRSLMTRINAAIKYGRENPDTVFILSGGQGRGEEITEAQCMYDYMVKSGIDGSRLILEDKATNTRENAKFSCEIIFSEDPGFNGRVCVITEVYHGARAKLCTENMGISDVVVKTGYSGYPILTVNYYLREVFALWNYIFFNSN